jgi:hypothetical protein
MFLIFDTYAGLCNQMYDIQSAINFCIINNIHFSFRYASLRKKKDLTKWYNVDFYHLFDDKFIKTDLYVPIDKLKLSKENTYNFDNDLRCIEWLNREKAIYPQLDRIDKQYIILRQFWSVYQNFKDIQNFYPELEPCNYLVKIYNSIRETLPEKYNLIHYRYEEDFIQHFQIKHHPMLCEIIKNNNFKDKTLPIYIAAYNIKNIPRKFFSKDLKEYNNILYKTNHNSDHLNFEELAFIDFMIGKNAQQIIGHSKSSFSVILNSSHNTNNYYI